MQAYLDLVNDINHLFIGLEYDEPCDICDGDMKLLDKAVTKFKNKFGLIKMAMCDVCGNFDDVAYRSTLRCSHQVIRQHYQIIT